MSRQKIASSALCVSLIVASIIALNGCAQTSPDVYSSRRFGVAQETYLGTVEAARPVSVQNEGQLGTLVGAALGGIGGSQIGGGTPEHIAGGIGGALLGGLLGREVDKAASRQPATEYVVRTQNGRYYTIVQGVHPKISVGERVHVQLYASRRARITPRSQRY